MSDMVRLVQYIFIFSISIDVASIDFGSVAPGGTAELANHNTATIESDEGLVWYIKIHYGADQSGTAFQFRTSGGAGTGTSAYTNIALAKTTAYTSTVGEGDNLPGGTPITFSYQAVVDANENGCRDPGEDGVGDVPVLLDGELNVRTDPNGRFEFRELVPGFHQLEVDTWELPAEYISESNEFLSVEAARGNFRLVEIGLKRVSVAPKPSPRPRAIEKKIPSVKVESQGTNKLIRSHQKLKSVTGFVEPPKPRLRPTKAPTPELQKDRLPIRATLDRR